MTSESIILSTKCKPHADEGLRLYVHRISKGLVSASELSSELGVKQSQLHRWLKTKPHFIQVGVRSVLFQKG